MHELLLAESIYQQMELESKLLPDVQYVTINEAGEIRRDGEKVEEPDLSIDMARLDMSLFMTAQVELITRLIEQTDAFRFVQTSAAGLDSPLFQSIVAKTDVFCNSDAQSASIAEFVVASVLNRWHRFDVRRQRQSAHEWQENFFKQILGSKWLIVGYGNIGQTVAKQVKGFGAEVTGVKRDLTPHEYADQLVSLEHVNQHIPEADVVVLSCPLNDQTSLLVNADFLSRMKPDAVLVNIGRGHLVDEDALAVALDDGKLDYAILDVFQNEPLPHDSVFWEHDRVQMTPHSSHRGSRTEARFEVLFTHNLKQFLLGKPVKNQVMPGSF
jgi:phosphoglycerate dehydrogenase-like enzyme